MTGNRSGSVASAGATRATSPYMRPNSRLQPSSSRAQSARPSSLAKKAPLSHRAHIAKVQWEAAHGEPCPYAYACPRAPAKKKRRRGHAAPMHHNSNTEHEGAMRTAIPGARSQHDGFGKGFNKNLNVLLATHHTMNSEAVGAGPASTDTGAAGATWPQEFTISKGGVGVNAMMGVNPCRRRKEPPTLLEKHQRVINAALFEISRPREGPFENLGERLGGEHEAFTYYSSQDGDGDGEGTNIESTARGPARFLEKTGTMRRASTATGERRAPTRTCNRPRPSTGPRFGTLTAGESFKMDLPRCNEPWKIPLLRTSWTPSNNSCSGTGDPFGGVEYDSIGPWLPESDREGLTSAAVDSAEHSVHSNAAAGASIHSNDAKEQSADKTLVPLAETAACLPTESLPLSHIAASQYVEGVVSKALLTPLPASEVTGEVAKEKAPGESHPLPWDGASEAGAPASRTAARHYIEDTVSSALLGVLLAVSAKEHLSMQAVESLQRDGGPTKEQVVAWESRVLAIQCAREYLQQGIHARQGGASGEGIPGLQTLVDTGTALSYPSEAIGHLTQDLSLGLAHPEALEKGCNVSGESGTTTPLSGATSRMSSDSSSVEFVLKDDSSTATRLGDETQLDHSDGEGLGSSYSLARAEALALATTAVVEEWVSGVVSQLANPTTQRTSAKIKSSPPSPVVRRECTEVTAGKSACDDRPPVHRTDIAEAGKNTQHAGLPEGGAMKVLPLEFLKDIVERRASLKPVATSRPTSGAIEEDRQLELDSRQQRERCAQQEAAARASALREFESLARAEGLDRYDPRDFSRGVLFGEGRHSVVYSAYAARVCEKGERKGHQDTQGAASTAAVIRHAVAAAMAREAIVDVLTTAVAAGIVTEAMSLTSTIPTVVSTALIDSVVTASVSGAVAATKTVLAAKEFRYARADVPVSILRKAHREVSMHLRVSGSPHVVALRGIWLTPRVTLLLEPMSVGNLNRFVRHKAAEGKARNDEWTTSGKRGERDEGRRWTSADAAWLVADAAEGLAALHSSGVVHRDVKSHNVMVAKRRQGITEEGGAFAPGWEAKLGDLGSATLVPPEGHAALTEETGTSGWMAPEIFGGQGYGTPVDVFSLGVLIWDAFVCGARDNPLCGLSGEACRLRDGLRPPWPRPPLLVSVPLDIERLAERCWVSDPGGRPTASAVANELRSFAYAAKCSVGTDLA